MDRPIDYLGVLQSLFNMVADYNQRPGSRIKIIQLGWDLQLNKARKAGELNLATNSTPKDDLVQMELFIPALGLGRSDFGTPIPAFTTALNQALRPILMVIFSSCAEGDGSALTSSEVELAFTLDDQFQIQFSEFARDDKSVVIHKLKFTIRAT